MLNSTLRRRLPAPLLGTPRVSVSRITSILGACGLALIIGTTVLVAARERQYAHREARIAARNAAFSLADHASRLFEVSDLALRNAVLTLGDRSPADVAGSRALWDEFRITSDTLPYIRDLLLTDADGRLSLATMAFPAPDVSMSDRDVFRSAKAGDGGLIVGEPLLGRVTGKPSFLIGRRIADVEGHFRGAILATADLAYFEQYWRRIDLPNEAHVAVVRADDGMVLVRLPESPAIAATSIPALKAAAADAPKAGRYGPAPGRAGFYQQIGDLPLYLTVSYSRAAVDDAWRAWLRTILVFPAGAVAALLALLAIARRQGRVEAQANIAVARARAALAAANGRLEQRVAERTADLRESNAEIQRFAYIVSHDLRSPLVNIMGFVSELERLRGDLFPPTSHPDPALTDDFDESIGFIRGSIDKMDRLIKAILLLARQGTRVFSPEAVDMEALMRSIVDGVAHRAHKAGATIEIGPLPSLVVDRIAIEQIFSNLVDNAVKYLRPGIPGLVSISAETVGRQVTFRVADNGRGIAGRDHERVFELFRRAGVQDQPGDGIGLAYVKTLVRQLGGRVVLESMPDAGSVFTVTLPMDRGEAEP